MECTLSEPSIPTLVTHPAPPASLHPLGSGLQRSGTAVLLECPPSSLRVAPSAGEREGGRGERGGGRRDHGAGQSRTIIITQSDWGAQIDLSLSIYH